MSEQYDLIEDLYKNTLEKVKESILCNPMIEDCVFKTVNSYWDDLSIDMAQQAMEKFFPENMRNDSHAMFNKYIDFLMYEKPRKIRYKHITVHLDIIKEMRLAGIISKRAEDILDEYQDEQKAQEAFLHDIGYIVRYHLITDIMDMLLEDNEFLFDLARAFAKLQLQGKDFKEHVIYHIYSNHIGEIIPELVRVIIDEEKLKETLEQKGAVNIKPRRL